MHPSSLLGSGNAATKFCPFRELAQKFVLLRRRSTGHSASSVARTLAVIVLAGAAGMAWGQTTNFTGNGDGFRWTDAANWDNGVPNSTLNTVVNTTATVATGGSATTATNNLNLMAGGLNLIETKLTVSGSMSNAGTVGTFNQGAEALTVAGDFSNTGSLISVAAGSLHGTENISVGGTLTNSGRLITKAATISVGGDTLNSGTLSVATNCNCNFDNTFQAGSLAVAGMLTNNGTLTATGFHVAYDASHPFLSVGIPFFRAAVTAAGYSGTGSIVASDAFLDFRTGGSNTFAPLDSNGTLTTGNYSFSGSSVIHIDPSGVNGGIVTIANGVTLTTGASNGFDYTDSPGHLASAMNTLSLNAGTLSLTSGLSSTNAGLTNSGTLSIFSDGPVLPFPTIHQGTLNFRLADLAGVQTILNVGGNFTNVGALNISAKVDPNFYGTGPAVYSGFLSAFGDFVNTGTVSNNGVITAGGNLLNSGSMAISGTQLAPGTLIAPASTFYAGGGNAPGTLIVAGAASNSGTLTFQNYATGSVGSFTNSGNVTVDGTSSLSTVGDFSNTSTGTVGVGGSLSVGGNLANSGTMNITGGTQTIRAASTWTNDGLLTNAATLNNNGTLVNNGTFTNTGTLNNAGQIFNSGNFVAGTLNNSGSYIQSAGNSTVDSRVVNTGTFQINGGTLTGDIASISNQGGTIGIGSGVSLTATNFTQTGGNTQVNGNITSTGLFEVDSGTLSGKGSITGNVLMGGIMSPGNSPGTFTINGNYTQTSTGIFNAEIAGLTPGSGYDQLIVNGNATLDGALDVELLNNFTVNIGDSFVLMTFDMLTGKFSFVDLPQLANGEDWLLSYDTNDIRLSVVASNAAPTPEPSTLLLLGSGVPMALSLRKKLGAKFRLCIG